MPPFLQNQKVQIGILAAGAVVALVFLFTQIIGSGGGGGDPSAMPMGGPGGPYGMPGMMPGMMPGGPGGYGPPGSMGAYGGYGTDTMAGTTGAPAAEKKKAGPKPPRSGDPFRSTDPLQDRIVEGVYRTATEEPPMLMATGPTPDLYVTHRWEKAAEAALPGTAPESPDLPMRMAGVLWGPRVYGLLEVNGQVESYTPGDTVASIYRVERIERDKMVLSKRLNNGKRKMVEVPLAGSPYGQQYNDPTGGGGYPGGYPGAPGMGGPGGPPGYGGYPGGAPGGPPGYGGPGGGG